MATSIARKRRVRARLTWVSVLAGDVLLAFFCLVALFMINWVGPGEEVTDAQVRDQLLDSAIVGGAAMLVLVIGVVVAESGGAKKFAIFQCCLAACALVFTAMCAHGVFR